MAGSKLKRVLHGMLFTIVMLFYFKSILVITTIMFVSDLLIRDVKRKDTVVKHLKRTWLHLTMAALHVYFPNQMYVNYDPIILSKTRNIVISNHVSEYDWVLILTLLYHLGRYDDVCIILKQSLRNIPLIGYGMECFGFIFLNRKLSADRKILNNGAVKLIKKQKYNLLIFPEGTYIDSESFPKSCHFAANNNLKVDGKEFYPKNVLVPRTSGFNIIKDSILQDIEGIIDITMVITPFEHFPQEEYTYIDTILDFRRRIHVGFHIDYISDKKEINDPNFLYNVFKKKDDLLEKHKNTFKNEIYKSLTDFKNKTSSLRARTYKFKTIDLRTKWDVLFYTTFLFSESLFAYFFYILFRRYIF